MLLLDFSQIVISSSVEYFSRTRESIDLQLLRHISLNNVLSYKAKFKSSLDDLIICLDGKDYWRKTIFPLYKQNRKQHHDESSFDWNLFFENFNIIKNEFKTELPFKVIEVYGCEADDVIAVICQLICPHQDKIIIVSSDKDLIQIQENICSKVEQYSPFHKKMINQNTNGYNLFEHVIRGDSGDGIPNILSDDDVFMIKEKRLKPIKATNILEWLKTGGFSNPEKFCKTEDMLEKFKRNLTLIDLQQIPECMKQRIAEEYNGCTRPNVNTFNYLVKHKLRKIIEKGLI